VMTRSSVGGEPEKKAKVFKVCPYCGEKLDLPKPPKFCPYCKEQLN